MEPPDRESEGRVTAAWPPDLPLPLPQWGEAPSPALCPFDTVPRYEDAAGRAEAALQRLLLDNNYDTVSNFVTFYDCWAASSQVHLAAFFRKYRPALRPRRHTCVGLGVELLRKLPRPIAAGAFLVSCEESIDDIRDYLDGGGGPERMADSVEKEHVMVAMPIVVEGRPGLMLCDPGYHVARVITVMHDRCYPHTGEYYVWWRGGSIDIRVR